MSDNASTKQTSILRLFCQSVCPANPPALSSRKLSRWQKQWESLVVVSSISVLGFAESRCGGRLTVQ